MDQENTDMIFSWLHDPAFANDDNSGGAAHREWRFDPEVHSISGKDSTKKSKGSFRSVKYSRGRNTAASVSKEYLLSAHSSPPNYFVKSLFVEHLDDDACEKLATEMTLLKRLRHVNILQSPYKNLL